MLWQFLGQGEHQACRIDPSILRSGPQIDAHPVVGAIEPQDASIDRVQNPHPYVKHRSLNLVAVVERAEYDPIFGQSDILPGRRRCDFLLIIADEETIRKMNDLLGIALLLLEG